jgi:hypothetical protein
LPDLHTYHPIHVNTVQATRLRITPALVESIICPNMQCIHPHCPMLLFSNQIAGELNEFFKGEE